MTLKAAYIYELARRKNFYRAASGSLLTVIIILSIAIYTRVKQDNAEIAQLNKLSCQICKHELKKAREMKILFVVDEKTY